MLRKLLSLYARSTPRFAGRDRILMLLTRLLGGDNSTTITVNGTRYILNGRDINEFYIFSRPVHSPQLHGVLLHALSGGGVYWDIGANIGGTSLPIARALPSAKVFAFEPSPLNCWKLYRNVLANSDLDNIHVVCCALSNKGAIAPFGVSNELHNSGVGGFGEARNREQKGLLVRAVHPTELLTSIPPPDVVKIDVEGFEFEVLSSLMDLGEMKPKSIIYEHSPYRFKERGMPLSQVKDLLESSGYDVRPVVASGEFDLERAQDFIARIRM